MSSKDTGKLAGKFFVCMIGLMLVLVAVLFQWLMLRSYLNAKQTREWPRAEAVVIRSSIEERQISGYPPEVRLNICFGYSYDGEDYVSDNITPRGSKWSKERASVTGLLADYPAGSTHYAWVNPESPNGAILQHDTKAAGYTLWFPVVIMVGGCGIIWGAVRDKGR